MQVLLCLVILALFLGILIYVYIRNQRKNTIIDAEDILNFETLVNLVTKRMADILAKDPHEESNNDEEFALNFRKHMEIEKAMSDCVYGIDKYKIIVKELIRSIIVEKLPELDDLHTIFPFNSPKLSSHWKFEILMECLAAAANAGTDPVLGKDPKNALPYLIRTYGWGDVKHTIEDGTVASYNVSVTELNEAYQKEMEKRHNFTPNLEYNVAATLIYEVYKGMGIIDTLRTQNIDGFHFGTSGSVLQATMDTVSSHPWPASKSVWIYFEGKYIHLQFLNFGTEAECRRVVQLIARYNNPGPLTEKRGFLVNTMYDKSRVLALRPPASEYWAVFVRKFVIKSITLEALINPPAFDPVSHRPKIDANGEVVPKYRNAQLPLGMVKLLMLGQVTTGFTGRQGSGKTTMMVAAISQVDGRFNIRVLEMAPEMYLREVYPQRDILSVAETPTVTAAMLQDALKKSDAALSIVGEVATDIIAARMIQMGQVASIFTIFSHHANRTVDLVHALTNSIVAASGGSATPATVEPQVIDVIKVDCHLDYDVHGNRYIERITEIVRLDSIPYPEQKPGEPNDVYKIRLDKEYYTRQTDRETFTTKDVLYFDYDNFEYKVARDDNGCAQFFSPELTKHIISRLPVEQRDYWKTWILENWR